MMMMTMIMVWILTMMLVVLTMILGVVMIRSDDNAPCVAGSLHVLIMMMMTTMVIILRIKRIIMRCLPASQFKRPLRDAAREAFGYEAKNKTGGRQLCFEHISAGWR